MSVAAIHYRESPPAADLAPFIDRFWGWWSEVREEVTLPVLLPGTGAELYCHVGTPFAGAEEEAPGRLLCLRSQPLDLGTVAGVGFVAVRFRAGMLGRFLAMPMAALGDGSLPLGAVWGRAGEELAWRVREAADWAARVRLLEDFLRARLLAAECRRHRLADPRLEQAVAALYRAGSGLGIEALAAAQGMSRRELERRFAQSLGVSPVGFRGLVRFQKMARALALAPQHGVLETALRQGYYDQAQCQHDFRLRAGMTPREWQGLAANRSHFYKTPR